jgi:UDP-glucose 4-epimerase
MNVLVTGASTPLGRAIVRKLVDRRRGEVLAVGIEARGRAQVAFGADYVQTDLTRNRNIRELIFGTAVSKKIEAVIHLAQHRSPRYDSRKAHRLHVDATRLMLRLCESHPSVRRFIHRSSAEVYLSKTAQPDVLREDAPLNLEPDAAPWIRDRVEADIAVCCRMGLCSQLQINVLRCAEILAPSMGSQLFDYLSSRVCLRPMGFDPILNLLSLEDASLAFTAALECEEPGVINVPGADTLPLSRAIRKWGRDEVPLPGPVLGPLYRLRSVLRRTEFNYQLNRWRFHFNGMLDGERAARLLGYVPAHPLEWPGDPKNGPSHQAWTGSSERESSR